MDTTSSLVNRYLAAQIKGDRAQALRLVLDDGLAKGIAAPDLHLSVIQPAQYEIGRLWQENRLTIAEEHVATAISQLVMSHLYPHLPREKPNGKRVFVACVEGELHDMGTRIAADFLEMAGFDVKLLGASVPTDSLVAQVEKERPQMVALSASLSFNLPAMRKAVTRLREAVGDQVVLAIGGGAVAWSPGIEAQLGLTSFGTDARALVAEARRALEVG